MREHRHRRRPMQARINSGINTTHDLADRMVAIRDALEDRRFTRPTVIVERPQIALRTSDRIAMRRPKHLIVT